MMQTWKDGTHEINWARDPLILVPIFTGAMTCGHFSGLIQGNRQDSQKVWTPSVFRYYQIIGRRNVHRSEGSSWEETDLHIIKQVGSCQNARAIQRLKWLWNMGLQCHWGLLPHSGCDSPTFAWKCQRQGHLNRCWHYSCWFQWSWIWVRDVSAQQLGIMGRKHNMMRTIQQKAIDPTDEALQSVYFRVNKLAYH